MSKIRLRARGSDGRMSIHTGADDLPFDAPLSHLSRVLFHSDLDYPAILSTHEGSTTFPALGAGSRRNTKYTLFAHGRPGIPIVLGQILNLAPDPVTFAGSVPMQMSSYGFARWLTLGADATNVIVHEQILSHVNAGIAAKAINWRVFVMDTILE